MTDRYPEPRAVFAYGTLRPGWGNHRRVVGDLDRTAWPATVAGFGLWVPSHRHFPYAWPTEWAALEGDVLMFPEDVWPTALARMDALEGHPDHYRRQVVMTTDGEPVWLYVATENPETSQAAHLLLSGDWADTRAPIGAT